MNVRSRFLHGLVVVLGMAGMGRAGEFTVWNASPTTAQSFAGTISDPVGPIGVTLTATDAGAIFSAPLSSSTFGTFYPYPPGSTAAEVYDTNQLPGTDDFAGMLSQSDSTIYTLTFSRPVVDPIFYLYNVDFRLYQFIGPIGPILIRPGSLNLVSYSATELGSVNPPQYDNDGSEPDKGNPNGSVYGSFEILGTYTSITWTRPLGVGAYYQDGNALEISVASVPEPSSLPMIATALGILFVAAQHRRRNAVKSLPSA